jgi:hypothetical protein
LNTPNLELDIYNIYGEKYLRRDISNGTVIQLDFLKPGLYFYEVMQKGLILAKGKLMKIN